MEAIRNANGDVVGLVGGAETSYRYDAFGRRTDYPGAYAVDGNPFRYCGEYYDEELGYVYLRARYYEPATGRFVSEDTHWNPGNLIYGDNPRDPLGLGIYTPDITAIIQSTNLYVYCGNNPLMWTDLTGEAWYHWVIGAAIVAAAAASVVITCGGSLPLAAMAVGSFASGVAVGGIATAVAAGAFVGAAAFYGGAALSAAISSKSIKDFNAQGNWTMVAFTAGGLLVGGVQGYTVYQNSKIIIAGKGSTGRVTANNSKEVAAMKQVMSDPLNGAKDLSTLAKNPVIMNDTTHGWLAKDGWVKMARNVNGVEIHFVYNTRTGVFDDFKFAQK